MTPQRPAVACRALLAALDAFEGRRNRRTRDTRPDAFGEGRLLARSLTRTGEISPGSVPPMAWDVLAEWRLAAASADFRSWLAAGVPSGDRA
jgi:hypothetical protein